MSVFCFSSVTRSLISPFSFLPLLLQMSESDSEALLLLRLRDQNRELIAELMSTKQARGALSSWEAAAEGRRGDA